MISNYYINIGFSELYNINSITNIQSIIYLGLLSNKLIKDANIKYEDLSLLGVQLERDKEKVDGYHYLHEYANLFFNARNSMMYYLIHNHNINDLCILVFDINVININKTYVSDGNCAKGITNKYPANIGYRYLNASDIKSRYWVYEDGSINEILKNEMSSEVLVLNKIPQHFIKRIIVANEIAKNNIEKLNVKIDIEINKDLFFC